eukprot:gb/GEZN01000021.1/.p1 GENE.gb/GEZN01000021.1/~~gb/GEZN01000021.1/.p1  ORF type:complete len:4174 (-),score=689.58 gb/GEZN01000021.1/:631-13152(-)
MLHFTVKRQLPVARPPPTTLTRHAISSRAISHLSRPGGRYPSQEQPASPPSLFSTDALVKAKAFSSRVGENTTAGQQARYPELFRNQNNKVIASFGGQGFDWVAQLKEIYHSEHCPGATAFTREFIQTLVDSMKPAVLENPKLFPKGLDVEAWIGKTREAARPPEMAYFSLSHISLPMIYLTQMAEYVLFAKTLEIDFGISLSQIRARWQSGIGHSQGMIAATVVSASPTFADLLRHSISVVMTTQIMGLLFMKRVESIRPSPQVFHLCEEKHWGPPQSMMAIHGWTSDMVMKKIHELGLVSTVAVALVNGRRDIVISGQAESIVAFRLAVTEAEAKAKEAMKGLPLARIPFSKRVPPVQMQFLSVAVPFHSPFGAEILALSLDALRKVKCHIDITQKDLLFPVWGFCGDSDIRDSTDIHKDILASVLTAPVRWDYVGKKVLSNGTTHIVDFGPMSGKLLAPMVNGAGVLVIDASGLTKTKQFSKAQAEYLRVIGRDALFEREAAGLPTPLNYEKRYAPKVTASGEVLTRFTERFRLPPFLVAGMTPTTGKLDIVAASSKAGYYCELAGGGLPTPKHFREAVATLTARIGPGATIQPNLLYLNQYLWNFQFPLCVKMKQEGYPIESITIAAGLPTPSKAQEVIQQMLAVGIRKLQFKPASSQAIKDIMDIAKGNPEMTIVVQWTGGLSGGHHSMEDCHEPLLENYHALRVHKNIVIVFGGGQGSPADAVKYLDGSWSTELGPFPAMPVDAILLGSRMMTSAEAETSAGARKLMLEGRKTAVPKAEWEKTMELPAWPADNQLKSVFGPGASGKEFSVVTIRSELEEPMHVLRTRGALAWLEFDRRFFSIQDVEARQVAIDDNKEWLISTLNQHFQKPYFCWDYANNKPAHDFTEMSYGDVSRRMLDLQFLPPAQGKPKEWIDITYTTRFQMWLQRTVERFLSSLPGHPKNGEFPAPSFISMEAVLADPVKSVQSLLEMFPSAKNATVHPEDVWYFTDLCRMPLKPMNFVPNLDAKMLKAWVKKDSLWYSEDPRSIPSNLTGPAAEHDRADRAIILQGPISVQYHTGEREPAAQILSKLQADVAKLLLEAGKEEYKQPKQNQDEKQSLPTTFAELSSAPWMSALLSPYLLRSNLWVKSPLPLLFRGPDVGQPSLIVSSRLDKASNGDRSYFLSLSLPDGSPHLTVQIKDKPKGTPDDVVFTFYHLKVPLVQKYALTESCSDMAPSGRVLEESKENFVNTATFYKKLWVDMVPTTPPTTNNLRAFFKALSPPAHCSPFPPTLSFLTPLSPGPLFPLLSSYSSPSSLPTFESLLEAVATGKRELPMEAGFLSAFREFGGLTVSGTEAPFSSANLLSLVHLGSDFVAGPNKLTANMSLGVKGELTGVYDTKSGRIISTKLTLVDKANPNSEPALELSSRCFIPLTQVARDPQRFEPLFNTFEGKWDVEITSEEERAVWNSQPWLKAIDENHVVAVGRSMQLSLSSKVLKQDSKTWTITTKGKFAGVNDEHVDADIHHVTTVPLDASQEMLPNPQEVCPVWQLLGVATRLGHAQPFNIPTPVQEKDENLTVYRSGVWSSPVSNEPYATASLDTNPLHTNDSLAKLAGFQEPIVHGMFMCAQLRRSMQTAIELIDGEKSTMSRFAVQFEAPVANNIPVESLVFSRGVHHGERVWSAVIRSVKTREVLVSATAASAVPTEHTAFLFTGQGSMFKGMGSEVWGSTDQSLPTLAAKEVWEQVEAFFMNEYGFSLMEIVKENPARVWIGFRTPGSSNGEKWKKKWASLQTSKVDEKGNEVLVPLFPQLQSEDCNHLCWETPNGALFQTQFQQPAIFTLQAANWVNLVNQGISRETVPRGTFAGHSLGEFSALWAMLPGLPVQRVAELVLLRGLLMQSAVPRDSVGRSKYGMVAILLNRLPSMKEEGLQSLIGKIRGSKQGLLDLVNLNSRGAQYVVAGDLVCLDELTKQLTAAVQGGKSPCVRLPGIDVPFHSLLFRQLTLAFRTAMGKMLSENEVHVDFAQLDGSHNALWIPNVTGTALPSSPLSDKAWLRTMADLTGSKLFEGLAKGSVKPEGNAVLAEIMAFQLAMPVQWIKTQDSFASKADWRRGIEIGPRATLMGMLQQLLKASKPPKPSSSLPAAQIGPQALFWPDNANVIMYDKGTLPHWPEPAHIEEEHIYESPESKTAVKEEAPETPSPETPSASKEASAPKAVEAAKPAEAKAVEAAPAPPPAPEPEPEPEPAPSGAGRIGCPDLKLATKQRLLVLLAKKLEVQLEKVDGNATLRQLTSGRSALQNELLSLIETEFGCKAEGLEDMKLTAAAETLGKLLKSSPDTNGSVLTGLISSWASQLLPAGYSLSDAQDFLKKNFSLTDSGVAAVCAQAIVRPPSIAAGRLRSKAEAEQWLSDLLKETAAFNGVQMTQASAGGGGGGGGRVRRPRRAARRSGGGPAKKAELPLTALQAMQVILAKKAELPLDKIKSTQTVRQLCGGRSALQNEILALLDAEFKVKLEGVEDLTLQVAAEKIESSLKIQAGQHRAPGEVLSGFISSAVSSFPSGFAKSDAELFLASNFNLSDHGAVAVLAQAATLKAPSSLEETKTWLGGIATQLAAERGVSLAAAGGGSEDVGGEEDYDDFEQGSSTVDAAVVLAPLRQMMQQQRKVLDDFLKMTEAQGSKEEEAQAKQASASLALSEQAMKTLEIAMSDHGETYWKGVKPVFNKMAGRSFDSWYHLGRFDLKNLLVRMDKIEESVPNIFEQAQRAGLWPADEAGAREFTLSKLYANIQRLDQTHKEVREFGELLYRIANRATDTSVTMVQAHSDTLDALIDSSEVQSVLDLTRQKRVWTASLRSLLNSTVDKEAQDLTTYLPQAPAVGGTVARFASTDGKDIGIRQYVDKMVTKPSDASDASKVYLELALDPGKMERGAQLDQAFMQSTTEMATQGCTFTGKTVLITGAGPNSIGSRIAGHFLRGGARVVVCINILDQINYKFFQALYENNCGKGSALDVVLYNAASRKDTEALVNELWDKKGLNMGAPDFFFPMAAIPENGRTLDRIDDLSEVAFRAMTTNINRIVGLIGRQIEKEYKETGKYLGASNTTCVLPLSPNHGIFGSDGMYANSKISLRTLYHKWLSEKWHGRLNFIGTEIGWTRSTGLMTATDVLAPRMEQMGVHTFSADDTAFFLVSVCRPLVVAQARNESPLHANLTAGLHRRDGESVFSASLYESARQKGPPFVAQAAALKAQALKATAPPPALHARACPSSLPIPRLPETRPSAPKGIDPKRIPLEKLNGMVDLKQVVVCVGYGEVGPFGSSRARWDWECHMKFSVESAIELARSLGLIKYCGGPEDTSGRWVDATSGEPVPDHLMWDTYEKEFRRRCGIRAIEPGLDPGLLKWRTQGYDGTFQESLKQVPLNADLPPFEVSSDEEIAFLRLKHGDNVVVTMDGNKRMASLKKGAQVYLPQRRPFSRQVAGLVPGGWSPAAYGLPDDICKRIDPVSVYALCATMDAFSMAGIRDPYELYRYLHMSEVGNCFSSCVGGMHSTITVLRDRLMDLPDIRSDVLQEIFVNTPAAWMNLLFLSTCGPIKPSSATCATAAMSYDAAIDTIRMGKAKFVLAGAVEDFSEDMSREFMKMQATSDSDVQFAKGYPADEHCRPTSSTRGGFMEAHGSGVQLFCTAEVALEMGLPVYGIIGGSHTAMDSVGRSVPAPGQGILSSAREVRVQQTAADGEGSPVNLPLSPLLDIRYRREQFDLDRSGAIDKVVTESGGEYLKQVQSLRLRGAQRTWGHDFWVQDPAISPLRGSLAVWGLQPDHIDMVSCHGTSTTANDMNEVKTVHTIMDHLGRTPGKPVSAICQKWLTGHPKGTAAAWMFNGVLQSISTGFVPGTKTAENISKEFNEFHHVLLTNQNLELNRPLYAALLHSFGFGQAGAQVLVLNADFLYGILGEDEYREYRSKQSTRSAVAQHHWASTIYPSMQAGQQVTKPRLPVKSVAPHPYQQRKEVFLDPTVRAPMSQPLELDQSEKPPTWSAHWPHVATTASLPSLKFGLGFGIDTALLKDFEKVADEFVQRNFTQAEIKRAQTGPRGSSSLAGLWCAKEAVFKCICSALATASPKVVIPAALQRGPGAPMKEIEIVRTQLANNVEIPEVRFSTELNRALAECGIEAKKIKLSISYSSTHAVAQAILFAEAP